MTAELGRQPWLVYGLFRTRDGYSAAVGSGEVLFTLIGFAGMYFVVGLLYVFLVGREVLHGAGSGNGARLMVELWFAILCLMLVMFAVLAGWDFGAGALHFIAARNQDERRALIAAIGPLWTWNEVWLVAGGGVLFVAFPRVLAISFPAYYLALFMVLWTLILRGIALEVRGLIASGLWRAFWDFAFAAANILLAILFGAAIGNVVRGMPLRRTSRSAFRCSRISECADRWGSSTGTPFRWPCSLWCACPHTARRIWQSRLKEKSLREPRR